MQVTVLLFDGFTSVFRAFDSVLDCRELASCAIDPDRKRVRFVASPRTSDRLVEVIYQQGGLVWCSRHALSPERTVCDLEGTSQRRFGASTTGDSVLVRSI